MRRELIAALGAGAVVLPAASIAQQNESVRRMAMLLQVDGGDLEAVQGGLQQLGWRDGSNLRVEILWLGKDDLSRGLACAGEAQTIRVLHRRFVAAVQTQRSLV